MTKISWNAHGVIVERRFNRNAVQLDRAFSRSRIAGTLGCRFAK